MMLHKLNLISEGDYRSAVAGGQAFVNSAPLSLVLVSDLSKLGDVKNNRTQMTGAMDVVNTNLSYFLYFRQKYNKIYHFQLLSQNISLFCSAARLATVPRATMDTTRLRSALKLKDGQIPMMNHPVGYFK
jgi:hypothetical protein